jgi:integrase
MRAIHGYSGHPVTALALKFAPLVFVRPVELRAAEWSEFDDANAEWRIPGTRMKMEEPHIVPLSRQALAILRELQPLARGGRYLFPSLRTRDRPMSDNTINAALRRLGYTKPDMASGAWRARCSMSRAFRRM